MKKGPTVVNKRAKGGPSGAHHLLSNSLDDSLETAGAIETPESGLSPTKKHQ